MKNLLIALFILLVHFKGNSQSLVPGFSKTEYIELLKIAAKQSSLPLIEELVRDSSQFSCVYVSPEMGLQNQWDLWTNNQGIAVISIRGTTSDFVSWLANFYAAMVPAKGSLQLEKNYCFNYELSSDPKAAVHTGWLIGTGMLARDILPRIDSLYREGTKNFLIMGHSQGGAIAYMLTSHLYYLRKTGRLNSDLVIKTYCSGAPKPGNLFYAYEFESMTADGWAYNVVNAADWVPEMPMTVQTTPDCNYVNPFLNAMAVINKQRLVQRVILKRAYNKLNRLLRRSQNEFEFYLGDRIYTIVRKTMPEFENPEYFKSINYVRTGKTIVLMPDDAYRIKFPDNPQRMFMHHLFEPYYFLISHFDSKVAP